MHAVRRQQGKVSSSQLLQDVQALRGCTGLLSAQQREHWCWFGGMLLAFSLEILTHHENEGY